MFVIWGREYSRVPNSHELRPKDMDPIQGLSRGQYVVPLLNPVSILNVVLLSMHSIDGSSQQVTTQARFVFRAHGSYVGYRV